MQSSVAHRLLPRGVHWADHLVGGCPVLLAIDSRGNCLKRVRMQPTSDEAAAREWLEGLLDHYDPVPAPPQLQLVKFEKPPGIPRGYFLALLRRP